MTTKLTLTSNSDSDIESVLELLSEGYFISAQKGTNHKGRCTPLFSTDDIYHFFWLRQVQDRGYLIYIEFDEHKNDVPGGLVCIDIDSSEIWERLMQPESRTFLGNPLINPTVRGGHLIYQQHTHTIFKRSIKRASNLGLQVNILPNKVCVLGGGRRLLSTPYVKHLSILPEAFLPYKYRNSSYSYPTTEGRRKESLLRWLAPLRDGEISKLALASWINVLFNVPPLDEEELFHICRASPSNAMDPSHDSEFEALKKANKEVITTLFHDTQVLVDELHDKICFDHEEKQWYCWQGEGMYWEKADPAQVTNWVEEVIMKKAGSFKTKLTASSLWDFADTMTAHLSGKLVMRLNGIDKRGSPR